MKFRLAMATCVALVFASVSQAAVFVGSYAVFDGPSWPTNPPVYSGREAAALIFGGLFTDYAISIDPSMDPNTITNTAWYDGWGEHQGMIFHEDYKLDVGNPGYNDPQGLNTARSAYVQDGLFDTQAFRNYVWRVDREPGRVPEPASIAVWSILAAGAACVAYRRRKSA